MFGGNLFVIVNDDVTFVPITDLAGKSEEDIEALAVERVTADVMSRLAEVSGDVSAPAVVATSAAASASTVTIVPVRQLMEEEIGLLEELEGAASDEEIAAALASIQSADVASFANKEAAEATCEAWAISTLRIWRRQRSRRRKPRHRRRLQLPAIWQLGIRCRRLSTAVPARLKSMLL